MSSGIYQIENTINGKRYIGSAVNIKGRFAMHKSTLRNGTHANRYLQRAWDKYGEEAFKFVILFCCSRESLIFHEQRAIDANNDLYNICPTAGNFLGCVHTEETKKKISESKKGSVPWNLNIPRTDEEKKKMSESHKGQVLSEEHKLHIAEAMKGENNHFYGKSHSGETKRKISEAKKGCSTWNKGKPFSEESKRKMSESSKGQIAWNKGKTGVYKLSEETRRKISENHAGGRRKITPNQVIEIRTLAAQDGYDRNKLSLKYDLTPRTIRKICSGHLWPRVGGLLCQI